MPVRCTRGAQVLAWAPPVESGSGQELIPDAAWAARVLAAEPPAQVLAHSPPARDSWRSAREEAREVPAVRTLEAPVRLASRQVGIEADPPAA